MSRHPVAKSKAIDDPFLTSIYCPAIGTFAHGAGGRDTEKGWTELWDSIQLRGLEPGANEASPLRGLPATTPLCSRRLGTFSSSKYT